MSEILGPDGRPAPIVEKRATFKVPPQWLTGVFTSQPTSSGERVTASIAMGLSAWFAAIRNISEDVAKLDLILYLRRGDGGKDRAVGNPLYELLHNSPNGEMTKLTFWETIMAHALGYANGYAEIQRNGSGLPIALWPIDPTTVHVRRSPDGSVFYEVWAGDGVFRVAAADMFHLHGLGPMGQGGYNLVSIAREALGVFIAIQKYRGSFFAGGAAVGAVLQHPTQLSDNALAHLRKSWEERHGTAANANRVAILEEGMQYTQLGVDPERSQLQEAASFTVQEVARFYRIPPTKLQSLEGATYSNISALQLEYLGDTLLPWIKRVEQEVSRKLLPAGGQLFAEHLTDSVLRADTAGRFAAYAMAISNGWMSPNEVRVKENMNPREGGDEFVDPGGPEPAPPAPSAEEPPDDEEPGPRRPRPSDDRDIFHKLADAHRPLLAERFRSILGHENGRVQRKGVDNGVFADHEPWLYATLDTAVEAYCRGVWGVMRGTDMPYAATAAVTTATVAMSRRHMDKVTERVKDWSAWKLDEANEMAKNEMLGLTMIMKGLCDER